jgi:SPP1 gp7 family putative phage head morphogenesis protein
VFSSFEAGYGKSLASAEFNTPDWEYLQQVKFNSAVWSAFKQNSQIKDAALMLLDDQGKAVPWKEFRDKAMQIDDTYNKRYLQTEYNQAHNTAMQARRWRDAEKTADLYPNMIYIAVQDGRTRATHMALHGTIRPINDPFWSKYTPPLDWGCRCTLRPTDKKTTSQPAELPNVTDGMDNNPGMDGKIFSDNHPYIKGNADRASELMAWVAGQIKSAPEIRESLQEYEQYGEEYLKAHFNASNGGYVVHHKLHDFDKRYGHHEKNAMEKLANAGDQIVALPETGEGTHLDLLLKSTGEQYELKSMVEGTSGGVKGALEDAFKHKKAENVILYWPNKIDHQIMSEGIHRFLGNARKNNIKIGNIFFIDKQGSLKKYKY